MRVIKASSLFTTCLVLLLSIGLIRAADTDTDVTAITSAPEPETQLISNQEAILDANENEAYNLVLNSMIKQEEKINAPVVQTQIEPAVQVSSTEETEQNTSADSVSVEEVKPAPTVITTTTTTKPAPQQTPEVTTTATTVEQAPKAFTTTAKVQPTTANVPAVTTITQVAPAPQVTTNNKPLISSESIAQALAEDEAAIIQNVAQINADLENAEINAEAEADTSLTVQNLQTFDSALGDSVLEAQTASGLSDADINKAAADGVPRIRLNLPEQLVSSESETFSYPTIIYAADINEFGYDQNPVFPSLSISELKEIKATEDELKIELEELRKAKGNKCDLRNKDPKLLNNMINSVLNGANTSVQDINSSDKDQQTINQTIQDLTQRLFDVKDSESHRRIALKFAHLANMYMEHRQYKNGQYMADESHYVHLRDFSHNVACLINGCSARKLQDSATTTTTTTTKVDADADLETNQTAAAQNNAETNNTETLSTQNQDDDSITDEEINDNSDISGQNEGQITTQQSADDTSNQTVTTTTTTQTNMDTNSQPSTTNNVSEVTSDQASSTNDEPITLLTTTSEPLDDTTQQATQSSQTYYMTTTTAATDDRQFDEDNQSFQSNSNVETAESPITTSIYNENAPEFDQTTTTATSVQNTPATSNEENISSIRRIFTSIANKLNSLFVINLYNETKELDKAFDTAISTDVAAKTQYQEPPKDNKTSTSTTVTTTSEAKHRRLAEDFVVGGLYSGLHHRMLSQYLSQHHLTLRKLENEADASNDQTTTTTITTTGYNTKDKDADTDNNESNNEDNQNDQTITGSTLAAQGQSASNTETDTDGDVTVQNQSASNTQTDTDGDVTVQNQSASNTQTDIDGAVAAQDQSANNTQTNIDDGVAAQNQSASNTKIVTTTTTTNIDNQKDDNDKTGSVTPSDSNDITSETYSTSNLNVQAQDGSEEPILLQNSNSVETMQDPNVDSNDANTNQLANESNDQAVNQNSATNDSQNSNNEMVTKTTTTTTVNNPVNQSTDDTQAPNSQNNVTIVNNEANKTAEYHPYKANYPTVSVTNTSQAYPLGEEQKSEETQLQQGNTATNAEINGSYITPDLYIQKTQQLADLVAEEGQLDQALNSFSNVLPKSLTNQDIQNASRSFIDSATGALNNNSAIFDSQGNTLANNFNAFRASVDAGKNLSAEDVTRFLDLLYNSVQYQIETKLTQQDFDNISQQLIKFNQSIEDAKNTIQRNVPTDDSMNQQIEDFANKVEVGVQDAEFTNDVKAKEFEAQKKEASEALQIQVQNVDKDGMAQQIRSISGDLSNYLKGKFGQSINAENLKFIIHKTVASALADINNLKSDQKDSGFVLDVKNLDYITSNVAEALKKARKDRLEQISQLTQELANGPNNTTTEVEVKENAHANVSHSQEYSTTQNNFTTNSTSSTSIAPVNSDCNRPINSVIDSLINQEKTFEIVLNNPEVRLALSNIIVQYIGKYVQYIQQLKPVFSKSKIVNTLAYELDTNSHTTSTQQKLIGHLAVSHANNIGSYSTNDHMFLKLLQRLLIEWDSNDADGFEHKLDHVLNVLKGERKHDLSPMALSDENNHLFSISNYINDFKQKFANLKTNIDGTIVEAKDLDSTIEQGEQKLRNVTDAIHITNFIFPGTSETSGSGFFSNMKNFFSGNSAKTRLLTFNPVASFKNIYTKITDSRTAARELISNYENANNSALKFKELYDQVIAFKSL